MATDAYCVSIASSCGYRLPCHHSAEDQLEYCGRVVLQVAGDVKSLALVSFEVARARWGCQRGNGLLVCGRRGTTGGVISSQPFWDPLLSAW
jgi:hypothetical protein